MVGCRTVAAKVRNDPCSADEDVAKLRLEMREQSLEELEEAGLVRLDSDDNTVKKGPQFDDKRLS